MADPTSDELEGRRDHVRIASIKAFLNDVGKVRHLPDNYVLLWKRNDLNDLIVYILNFDCREILLKLIFIKWDIFKGEQDC
jgi:predicted component of viral defense system (DUF524 family)